MSITDELREWWVRKFPVMDKELHENFAAIADSIDAEHEKACDDAWNNGYEADYLGIEKWLTEHPQAMEHHGWVRLPKDADGEYIHVGDVMERGKARGRVIALMLSNYPKKWGGGLHWGVQLEGEQAPTALDLTFHHYHEPTVEDVLRDVVTLCHNTWKEGSAFEFYDVDDVMKSSNIAEYAAKLRLVESEDA